MGDEGQVMRMQAIESSFGFLGPLSAQTGPISYFIPSQLRQSCVSVHGGGGGGAGLGGGGGPGLRWHLPRGPFRAF